MGCCIIILIIICTMMAGEMNDSNSDEMHECLRFMLSKTRSTVNLCTLRLLEIVEMNAMNLLSESFVFFML